MPRSAHDFHVLAFAIWRRVQRLIGREPDYFTTIPAGVELSPSARHFADYETAPLKLCFAATKDDVSTWQANARNKLAELAGYRREAEAPRKSHESSAALPDGLPRRTVYLKARAGVDIPVHLIGPENGSGRRPVMICLQGTNTGAHLSWGEVRFPADIGQKMQGYDFAIQAARRGYLAVAIEQIGFGVRAERAIRPRSAAPCVDATMHAILLGRSLMGERCSDVSAVIDWLMDEQQTLGIDIGKIHVMGHSSGGSVALHAAALDTRIGAVLACGCVGPIRETIGRRRDDQGQNVIPGILNWLELADIVGLVAPRPFVTVAGESDHIWSAAAALKVVGTAEAVYERFGATRGLRCVSMPGGHMFRPEVSWKTFEEALSATGHGRAEAGGAH